MSKVAFLAIVFSLLLAACSPAPSDKPGGKPVIVVTYSVLGAVVKDLVGDQATVEVPIPNGQDPHEWEPSAKDIELITKADLIVQNGLGLEGGMEKTLAYAAANGVKTFIAADHITVRKVGQGEGIPGGDTDQSVGASDPHLWMDPLTMKQVVAALADQLKTDLGLDVSGRAQDLENRLDELDREIAAQVASLPAADRKLVTGHESLGYYAQRYGFKLVGAIVPSLTIAGGSLGGRPGRPEEADPGKPGESGLHRAGHPQGRFGSHRQGDGRQGGHAHHPQPAPGWLVFHLFAQPDPGNRGGPSK